MLDYRSTSREHYTASVAGDCPHLHLRCAMGTSCVVAVRYVLWVGGSRRDLLSAATGQANAPAVTADGLSIVDLF